MQPRERGLTVPARTRTVIPPELFSLLRNLIEAESGTVLNDSKLPHLSAVVRGRMETLGIADARGTWQPSRKGRGWRRSGGSWRRNSS